MTLFEQFCGGNLFVVNLERRPDRMERFNAEMGQIGLTVQRFNAIDAGPDWGNNGCSASHKALLDQIARSGAERAAVFEDDAAVRVPFVLSFQHEVMRALGELPDSWDLCYLGAGYGDKPQGWHSRHLIRVNGMKTTSSYVITAKAARKLSDMIPDNTTEAIDEIFSSFCRENNCFVMEPRLFIQYESYSDLQKRVVAYQDSMENRDHVAALGKYLPK